MNQKPQIQLTEELLKSSTPINVDGNSVFSEGVILRKLSKFAIAAQEDAIIPIPVFYDTKTGKVLVETLPQLFREEFKEYNKKLDQLAMTVESAPDRNA
mgnify:CR=1 FL=1